MCGELPFLNKAALGSPALRCPGIFLCCGFPLSADDLSIGHVEHQNALFWHNNFLHLGVEHFIIKFGKFQDLGTFGSKDVLSDILCRTGAAFLFLRSAAVGGVHVRVMWSLVLGSILTGIPHKTGTAVPAFDFTGEAGSFDAPVCEYSQFSAAHLFILHSLIDLHRNNRFVRIFHEILRKFTIVLFALAADGVYHIFLLKE